MAPGLGRDDFPSNATRPFGIQLAKNSDLVTLKNHMPSQPIVSVCIPSHNSQEFIATTLEGILDQTFGDFEVVIADDKSTDRTVPIIKSFKDPRIRLIENQLNLGLGRNWNKVLSCAQGEYVKLLGDDDLLYPQCLARQIAALQRPANATAVLAICNRNLINARNEVVMRRRWQRCAEISGLEIVRP